MAKVQKLVVEIRYFDLNTLPEEAYLAIIEWLHDEAAYLTNQKREEFAVEFESRLNWEVDV